MGDACWDDVLGRMPEETLLVRRAAFGELVAAGEPVGFDRVAAATGLTRDATRRALRLVESAGMAETNEDHVVGIDGLTTSHAPHDRVERREPLDVVRLRHRRDRRRARGRCRGRDGVRMVQPTDRGRHAEGKAGRQRDGRLVAGRVLLERAGAVLSLGLVLLLRGASGAMEGGGRSAVRRGARSPRARPIETWRELESV
jgi:hypothetical protein